MALPVKTSVIECSTAELLGRPLNDIEKKYDPERLYVASNRPIPLPDLALQSLGRVRPRRMGLKQRLI